MLKPNKKSIFSIISIFILSFFFVRMALAEQISSDSVIRLVNKERDRAGLAELVENEKLDQVAADKLNDMIKNDYFAHTSPAGNTPWYWYGKNMYDYRFAGENLAINFMTAEEQNKAWMASPTHRKNILNPNYQEIGVAVAAADIKGQTSIVTVQEFGTLVGAAELPPKKVESVGVDKNLGDITKPSVMAVKDVMNEDKLKIEKPAAGTPTPKADSLMDAVKNNKYEIAEFGYVFSILLFILSVMVAPAVIVVYSFEKLIRLVKIQRIKTV